jgi:riboflavin kinase/FMN adenylyltransferase
MLVARSLSEMTRDEGTVLTIGSFDGVHRGHRAILDETLSIAARDGLRSVLVTFDPHPREVVRHNGELVLLLTTVDERLRILEPLGLDVCLVLPFTRDISMLDAGEFFKTVLLDRIGARHIVVGVDHAFGRGRGGRIEELQRLGTASGVAVTVVPSLEADGVKIGSSVIRAALLAGDIERATLALGRPYSLSGVIRRGDGLGRQLGYPTANLHLDSNKKLLPRAGVYAVRASMGDGEYAGMMNIGFRPTVSDTGHISTEVHLFDFHDDIYGRTMDVRILARLRDEEKFASADALIAQLRSDGDSARRVLAQYDNTTLTHS